MNNSKYTQIDNGEVILGQLMHKHGVISVLRATLDLSPAELVQESREIREELLESARENGVEPVMISVCPVSSIGSSRISASLYSALAKELADRGCGKFEILDPELAARVAQTELEISESMGCVTRH